MARPSSMAQPPEMLCCPSHIHETCAVLLARKNVPLVRTVKMLGDCVDLFALSPILVLGIDLVKMYRPLRLLARFRKREVRLRV